MTTKNILIVHEDSCVSHFLKHFFIKQASDIKIVRSYHEVIDAISKKKYDVIITDLTITGNFSYRYLESLKEKTPTSAIVVISEMEFKGTKQSLKQMGAHDFVQLPLDLWSFTKKIDNLLCA